MRAEGHGGSTGAAAGETWHDARTHPCKQLTLYVPCLLQRVLGDGGAGGEADAPDDVSDVTGLTGMSRVTATSAGRNSLRPEEEDLVDRLLALDDEEVREGRRGLDAGDG